VLLRLGLDDASPASAPRFEMHWRGGKRSRSRER
jgi:hypothetical protein